MQQQHVHSQVKKTCRTQVPAIRVQCATCTSWSSQSPRQLLLVASKVKGHAEVAHSAAAGQPACSLPTRLTWQLQVKASQGISSRQCCMPQVLVYLPARQHMKHRQLDMGLCRSKGSSRSSRAVMTPNNNQLISRVSCSNCWPGTLCCDTLSAA